MKKSAPPPDNQELILSNVSPSPVQRRLAFGVVLVLLVCSVGLAGPLSSQPLGRIDAFMPTYGTAIFVSDSITAVLLFAQFSVLRSPALLALASGYLWSGFIAIPWVLTFPGVLPQAGPMGSGLQSTPWLYLFWHEGFIIFVIVYVLLKDFDPLKTLSKTGLRGVVLGSIASVAALVVGATALVTVGHALMPPIMVDTVQINLIFYLLGPLYAMTIVAFVLLCCACARCLTCGWWWFCSHLLSLASGQKSNGSKGLSSTEASGLWWIQEMPVRQGFSRMGERTKFVERCRARFRGQVLS
jgi:Membrane-associated sensor, integral membrane domain